ncbi:MAG: GMC family oxidoreductase, partial [Rhabdaerophilum sp.]
FLEGDAERRANLTILTGAEAERVLFDGNRASGLAFRQNGIRRIARARRSVVLAAGAVASPKLLMLSGIGGGEALRGFGLDIVADRPGVGRNLQDHLQIRPIYKVRNVRTLNADYANLLKRAWMGVEFALFRTGPMTMAPSQLGVFTRSDARYAMPNLQFHVQPLSLDKFGEGLHPFPAFTASVCNLRPTSRGEIRLASADPFEAPVIDPNYLATEEDRQVAADSLRLVRRIVASEALRPFQPEEYRPGPDIRSETDLIRAAGDLGTTIFHPVGTARMGRRDDPLAVVDERLSVIGVEGLRVIDASVMPTITSGNTNSPTLMIAEKGAAMLLADTR